MEGILQTIAAALADGKAEDVVILPAEQQSGGMFTHMVIATATAGRHAAALAARVLRAQKAAGEKKGAVEASAGREWVLIDCGAVIVHIMQKEARLRYRLEELWGFEGSGA